MSRNNRNKQYELNPVDARDGWPGLLSEDDVLGAERARRQHFNAGNFYGKPDRTQPIPPTRTLQEIADPYRTVGSALAGIIPSGLGGIAAGAIDAIRGGPNPTQTFADTVTGIQEDFTRLPRTARGQEDLLSALETLESIPYLKEIGDAMDVPGEMTMDATGSPWLAAGVDMIPDIIETAIGAGPALRVGRNVSRTLGKLDPGTVGSASGKMGGNMTGGIGGRNAAQLNPMVVRLADDMRKQGISKEDIWNVTGRRYDQPAFFDEGGNFGFEFDDSKAGYLDEPRNYTQDLRALDGRRSGVKRLRELEKMGMMGAITTVEAAEKDGLRAQFGMLKDYGSMRAAFQHPEVDKHYPTLLDETGYSEGYLSGALGQHESGANKVTINPQAHRDQYGIDKMDDEMRSTALHEFAGHAIQDREKMPAGGSPRDFAQQANMDKIRINGFRAKAEDADKVGFADVANTYRAKAQALQDKLEADPRSPDDKYYALTGEANARAIEARRNLTMEERLARPFWLDYDKKGQPSDQIVKYR